MTLNNWHTCCDTSRFSVQLAHCLYGLVVTLTNHQYSRTAD